MIYNHGKHEIELWDSIHNLPVLRFQRLNKYQMQSSEIGNTFDDYDQRTVKALQFIQKGMKDEAMQELENRRQTVYNALNDFTPVGRCFAILVKRIDSHDYSKGFAPDDLDRVLAHLERIGLGMDVTIEQLSQVKKKIETELVVYYPSFFPKNGNRQQTSLRIRRMKMMLDGMIEPDPNDQEHLFNLEKEILETDRPNKWNVWSEGNMERVLEVDFRKFGIAVMEHSSESIEQISTFTFYATVEHLKEKFKK